MMTRTTGVRATATALAVAVVASGVAACGSEPEPPAAQTHLSITSSDSPDTVTLDATEGEEARVTSAVEGEVTLEVDSVDEDEVEFTTGTRMAPEGETGGINLNDLQTRFTATKGEETKFSTPTMDAGTTWTVTLEEGSAPT